MTIREFEATLESLPLSFKCASCTVSVLNRVAARGRLAEYAVTRYLAVLAKTEPVCVWRLVEKESAREGKSWRELLAKLEFAPEIAAIQLRRQLIDRLRNRPGRPLAMHFIPTHVCNARCSMCGIWQDREAVEMNCRLLN